MAVRFWGVPVLLLSLIFSYAIQLEAQSLRRFKDVRGIDNVYRLQPTASAEVPQYLASPRGGMDVENPFQDPCVDSLRYGKGLSAFSDDRLCSDFRQPKTPPTPDPDYLPSAIVRKQEAVLSEDFSKIVGLTQHLTNEQESAMGTPPPLPYGPAGTGDGLIPLMAGPTVANPTVSVLAREFTYGAGGPDVPIRIDVSIAGQPAIPLFGGADIQVDSTDTLPLSSPGEEFVLIGRGAWPSFDQPNISYTTPSNHATHAVVLLRGDYVSDILLQKGGEIPYGTQLSVESILESYGLADSFGQMILPENQMVILYELSTADPASPAYDLQDLVLLVTADGPIRDTIVIQDRICSQYACSGDTPGHSSTVVAGGPFHTIAATHVQPPVDGTLTEISGVFFGARPGGIPDIDWEGFGFAIYVWNSPGAFQADPLNPNHAVLYFDDPSNPDYLDVVGEYDSSIGLLPKHRLVFDISSQGGLELLAGEEYVVAITGGAPISDPGTLYHSFSDSTDGGFGSLLGDLVSYHSPSGDQYGPDFFANIQSYSFPSDYLATRVVMEVTTD